MNVRRLTSEDELNAYDAWVKSHPQGNLWQSLEWKQYQESMGREVRIYAASSFQLLAFSATAMVVIDQTVGGLSTWDIPRGPLSDVRCQKSEVSMLLEKIVQDAKKETCLSCFISPLEKLPSAFCLLPSSDRHQQPSATRILDLTLSDELLLAQMHQKGRYNMGVARKNGVSVEQSKDIDAYYELAKKTGSRDGFGIPSKNQLKAFLENLKGSFLLLANNRSSESSESSESSKSSESSASSPIAGLIGITWNKTAIYYYGASDYEHRALMAPYLLQWEAIQLCKKAGCTRYDLLGIAPIGSDVTHPWAGISSFKAKFGGTVISYPPEQEITLRPMVKWVLGMKRKWVG